MKNNISNSEIVQALLVLHEEYKKNLAPLLHLTFAQIRTYYDNLYETTDVFHELDSVVDQIDFPLDQLLTNIKLLEKVFDDIIRPIAPERFAKNRQENSSISSISVMSQLLSATDKLLRLNARLELEGDNVAHDFKKVVAEINLLCVLFLQFLKEDRGN